MGEPNWVDIGSVDELKARSLTEITVGRSRIALSWTEDGFGAISGVCNHVGGPLGQGRLAGDYVVCPWHNWKFHRVRGSGEPGYEQDAVPCYALKEENGRLFLDPEPRTRRSKKPHPPHPLERSLERAPGPLRVLGLSTTAMDAANPRYSTSDDLLETAVAHACSQGAEGRVLRLNDLTFRNCEGYYSKSARACTWPCSITQMDSSDEMDQVYEAVVFWADVVIVSTPIRWGNASALYYKMVERMNCVQNQVTIRDRVLIQNKVASFIITGGQDNIQAVAGQLMVFWSEIGFHFPQFPFIAHSRGWSAEDMERNVAYVQRSAALCDGARALAERSLDLAGTLVARGDAAAKTERGGRKAQPVGGDSAS